MEKNELNTIIEQCRTGDPTAQEQLVLAAQNKVYYHCKKFLKNEEDAQDATQDVLITMLTNLDKLREPAAFWGWLNSITANRCKHVLTRSPKEWQIPEDEEGNSMLDSIETLDDQVIPDKALDNEETRRLVMEIIDGLPAEQRMTVVFFYYDEMPVRDIAAAMEVSEGTVKSRLNYARRSIKAEVEKLEKKGTKLYSVSFLPFLAYFLRLGMESQTLAPETAAAITEGTLSAAGSVQTAVTAGSAGTGAAGAGMTGGTGAAAGGVTAKLIAAVLAGVLVLGGAGAALFNAFRPSPEPADTEAVETPAPTTEPTAEPTPEPTEPPRPYAAAYIAAVTERGAQYGADTKYGLVYIDGDSTPELVISYWGSYMQLYTVAPDGTLITALEEQDFGRMGYPSYVPRENLVYAQYLSMNGDRAQEFYALDENGKLLMQNSESVRGQWSMAEDGVTAILTTDDTLSELPEGEMLCGDMSAQEILELLRVDLATGSDLRVEPATPSDLTDGNALMDFSPYVGTYTADAQMQRNYQCQALDLTLNSDGSLSGGGAIGSRSTSKEPTMYPTATPPLELREGSAGDGGTGTYSLYLRFPENPDDPYSNSYAEYYVIYPAGVSDGRGGDTSVPRIHYVRAMGGVWDMLYTLKQ